jgi:hypothetical protein
LANRVLWRGVTGGGHRVHLLSALRQSVQQAEPAKPCKKPKKATGQKEMQLLIEGKMPKKASAKTTAAKPEHKSA